MKKITSIFLFVFLLSAYTIAASDKIPVKLQGNSIKAKAKTVKFTYKEFLEKRQENPILFDEEYIDKNIEISGLIDDMALLPASEGEEPLYIVGIGTEYLKILDMVTNPTGGLFFRNKEDIKKMKRLGTITAKCNYVGNEDNVNLFGKCEMLSFTEYKEPKID